MRQLAPRTPLEAVTSRTFRSGVRHIVYAPQSA